MISKKQIREAVTKNRGGFEKATDAQIMTIWNALTDETRKQYLESVSQKGSKDANSTGPKGDV